MSLFKRISTIFKANVNHAITQAEDPEKILDQVIIEMNQQLRVSRQKVAAAIADEKRLHRDYTRVADEAKGWEEKATIALEQDREDLARQALERRNESQQLADEYQVQWEKQKQAVDGLKDHLGTLQRKIEEASRKKNLLLARQKRAKAQKQIHETMSGMRENSAFGAFERMEDKINDMEARADAAEELSEDFSDTKLEDEFAELAKKDSVDDDLAALRAKLGK
jgi:phage shock protein A